MCIKYKYYLIDTSIHKNEDWSEGNGSGLLIGWPRRGETAHVFPAAAALNAAHMNWAKKATFMQLFVSLALYYWSEERFKLFLFKESMYSLFTKTNVFFFKCV